MRFLVWVLRIVMVAVIGSFVATVFYLTHDVAFSEGVKAALNWVTVAGTAVVGLAWPLMRRYWQALLLLLGLGAFRALFGTHPALPTLEIPLLTPFQSDFLWVPIGVVFVSLVGCLVTRAIVSDRNLQAMKRAAASVTTGQDVAEQTTAALQEVSAPTEPQPVAPEMEVEAPEVSESVEEPSAPPAEPAKTKVAKKK